MPTFIRLKDALVSIPFDKAVLTYLFWHLGIVANHIGVPSIPKRHHPQRDNDAYRETRDFRNELHSEILMISDYRIVKANALSSPRSPIIGICGHAATL